MPRKTIRGVEINYEIFGDEGPWCVMTASGRFPLDRDRPLARLLADGGYRVLIYDRRNTGASDVGIGPEATEDEIFAEDMRELLAAHDALPVFNVGIMAGNRPALHLTLRHPEDVRGYVSIFPSGGEYCAGRLAPRYYGDYADLAEQGGMEAVCQSDHYGDRIAANPRNRQLLLAMDAGEFAATMRRWAKAILDSGSGPTIGFSEDDLRRVDVPTLVFPGLLDDPIHGYEPGAAVGRLIKGARVVELAEDRKPDDDDGSWLSLSVRRRMADPELAPAILSFFDECVAAERKKAGVDPAE